MNGSWPRDAISDRFGAGFRLRLALLLILNGIAVWFLAVIATAYVEGTFLPWGSTQAAIRGMISISSAWMRSPMVTGIELVGYVGAGLVLAGVSAVVLKGLDILRRRVNLDRS